MRHASLHLPAAVFAMLACMTLFAGCKTEKKYLRYATLYAEQPQKIYILPVSDHSKRKETADSALLATYHYHDLAADQMFASIVTALKSRGYAMAGHDQSTQIADLDQLNRKELITGDLGRFRTSAGIDAVLITTLYRWNESRTNPTAYIQVQLRSTQSGKTLLQAYAKVSRPCDTSYRGALITLPAEQTLADTLHTSIDGGIRSYMMQQAMMIILQDLPFHPASFYYMKDQYLPANDEYLHIVISSEGGVEVKKISLEEYENGAFV